MAKKDKRPDAPKGKGADAPEGTSPGADGKKGAEAGARKESKRKGPPPRREPSRLRKRYLEDPCPVAKPVAGGGFSGGKVRSGHVKPPFRHDVIDVF